MKLVMYRLPRAWIGMNQCAPAKQNYWTDRGNVIGIQMCRFPRSWIIIVLIPATVDQHILTPTKKSTLSDRSDSKF